MLKKSISYTNFNDEQVVEVVYFNLSQSELVEMEAEDSLRNLIQRVVESTDAGEIVGIFKKIILASYGKKSDDGKSFVKDEAMAKQFSQTAAYDALFMQLATDTNAAAEFIKGIMPAQMVAEMERELQAQKEQTPISPEEMIHRAQQAAAKVHEFSPPPLPA